MWHDKPHESPKPESDMHSNQRLGSLLSSNKWQMQQEHLLQNVSSIEREARQAEFLHVHELEDLKSGHGSGLDGIRTGFSPFLCFLDCWIWSLELKDALLISCVFDVFLQVFISCSDMLLHSMKLIAA